MDCPGRDRLQPILASKLILVVVSTVGCFSIRFALTLSFARPGMSVTLATSGCLMNSVREMNVCMYYGHVMSIKSCGFVVVVVVLSFILHLLFVPSLPAGGENILRRVSPELNRNRQHVEFEHLQGYKST